VDGAGPVICSCKIIKTYAAWLCNDIEVAAGATKEFFLKRLKLSHLCGLGGVNQNGCRQKLGYYGLIDVLRGFFTPM
jgi:hypothetical protein